MGIKFIGDRTKVITKDTSVNKTGPMLRRRAAIIQQIINGTATITPAADYYTKMLLHFDDSNGIDTSISAFAPMHGVLSPDGTRAYVGSWGSSGNGVHFIDVATNTKLSTTSTTLTPIHVSINSTGSRIYAAGYGTSNATNDGNILYIIDTTSGNILHSVTVGVGCHSTAITPNDKFLFVTCETGGLYRIDLTATTPTAIQLGNASWGKYAPIVSPDGTRLYVSVANTGKVYTLDQNTGNISLLSTLTGFSNTYSAIKTSTTAYYFNNNASGTVTPILFSTSTTGSSISVGNGPYGASVSPDGKKLYVPNVGENTVSVIDTGTNSVISTFTGFSAPRAAIATNSKLLVLNIGNNTITVRNALPVTEEAKISFNWSESGIFVEQKQKIYIASKIPSGNVIKVIDAQTNLSIGTVPVTGSMTHFTSNSTGTRIYAANNSASWGTTTGTKVLVIDTTNDVILSEIVTGSGVHSTAITPNDKFLFVACQNAGLYRIDLTAPTPTATLLGNTTWGQYAPVVSPDGSKLFVNTSASTIKVYSLDQNTGDITLLTTFTSTGTCKYAVKNSSNVYYSTGSNPGKLLVIDFTSLTKTEIALPSGVYDVAHLSINPGGKKVYFSAYSTAQGAYVNWILNVASNSIITSFNDSDIGQGNPIVTVATNERLFLFAVGAYIIKSIDARALSDSSQSPLTQYRIGTVNTSTTQSKFGGKSLALNGTNTNKLQFANPKGKAMDLSNKPFCVEGWFYLTGVDTNTYNTGLLTFANTDGGDFQGAGIFLNASTRYFLAYFNTNGTSWDIGSPTISTTVAPNLNTWFHIALIRETTGGDVKLVYNGTVIGTKTTSASLYTGDYFYVGKTNYRNSTRIDGYVDDVRVVVGSCPYSSAAFVVPTTELAAITNTKVLLKGANVTKDDSSLNLYTQALGSASSSTVQSKFGGSSIKIASATGDFIKVYNNTQPIALLDRPFTIEGWFWLNSNTAGYQPLIDLSTTADFQGPIILMESNNTLAAYLSTNGTTWAYALTSTFTPSANAWHHIALVREYKAGPIKLYCDGIVRASNNGTSEVITAETIWLGHYPYWTGGARTLNGYIDEVRITLDYCAYNGNFTPAAAPFTDGKNCLLHFEGTNGSTTITDSSTSPKTFTAYGTGTAISTTKSKFGSSSLYLAGGRGSGARVAAASSDFAVGSGDFTIEYWFNMSAMSTGHVGTYFNSMIDTRVSSQNGHVICTNSANKLMLFADGGIYLTCNSVIQLNTWNHVAVSRKGNTVYAYLNGVLDGSAAVSFNLAQGGLMLGNVFDYSAAPGLEFNGYIDEVRFTKGTALYYISSYGNFTVPTSEFSDGKNLLMHFNGANGSTTMTDSSTSAKAATAYSGAVISTSQSKFSGSSLYLPGNPGNMVTVSNSSDFAFGTGDFTVEYWMNISAISAGYSGYHNCMFDTRSAGNNGLFFFMNSSRQIRAYACGSFFMTSTGTVPMNEWVNIAFVRKEGVFYLYINGVLDTTVSASLNMTENKLTIGCNYEGATFNGIQFNGYIDEFRVTKGEALYYGSDYVVPTTPFTLIG